MAFSEGDAAWIWLPEHEAKVETDMQWLQHNLQSCRGARKNAEEILTVAGLFPESSNKEKEKKEK